MNLFKNENGNIGMIVAWSFVVILLFLIAILYFAQHEAIFETIDGLDSANNDSVVLDEGVPDISNTLNLVKYSWGFAFVILVVGVIGFGIMYSIKREEDSKRRF